MHVVPTFQKMEVAILSFLSFLLCVPLNRFIFPILSPHAYTFLLSCPKDHHASIFHPQSNFCFFFPVPYFSFFSSATSMQLQYTIDVVSRNTLAPTSI